MTHVFLAASFSIYHFFAQGGFFMILLLICSVVSCCDSVAWTRADVKWYAIGHRARNRGLQPDDTDGVVRLSRPVRNDLSALANRRWPATSSWPKSENIEAVNPATRGRPVESDPLSGSNCWKAPLLGLLGRPLVAFASLGASANIDPRGIAKGISAEHDDCWFGNRHPQRFRTAIFPKIETMAAMESLIADLLAKCYTKTQANERASPRSCAAGGPGV
jgi:hypothetical protein